MSRVPRMVLHERQPLPVGTVINDGTWTLGEIAFEGGRHLQYRATGRGMRKAALKEYFPPNWKRDGDSVLPHFDAELEQGLRRFFFEALEMYQAIPSSPQTLVQLDLFQEHNTHYAAYEWMDGVCLAEQLKQKGTLGIKEAWTVLVDIGSALHHFHELGILHRDVNPQNILVEPTGRARLADYETISPFPTARQFPHLSLANPQYAPIEMLSVFSSYGPQTDVYALAAVAYQMLTGRRVPPSASRVAKPQLMAAHQVKSCLNERISSALDRALQVRAKDRTSSVGAFLADLHEGLSAARSRMEPEPARSH